MSMSIELDGYGEVDGNLQRMVAQAPDAAQQANRDNGTHLLGESVMLAPIEFGDLRGSGNMAETEDGVEVRFQMRYAAVQHERLDFNHPRGGGPKYLEQPMLENRDKYLQHVRDNVRRVIG